MKPMFRSALAIMAAFGLVLALSANASAQGSGKGLFVKMKCNSCHSVTAQAIKLTDPEAKPNDLSKVGKTRDAKWIVGWLNRTEKIKGKTHKKKFAGKPADAQAIATWLATLK